MNPFTNLLELARQASDALHAMDPHSVRNLLALLIGPPIVLLFVLAWRVSESCEDSHRSGRKDRIARVVARIAGSPLLLGVYLGALAMVLLWFTGVLAIAVVSYVDHGGGPPEMGGRTLMKWELGPIVGIGATLWNAQLILRERRRLAAS